MVSIGDTVVDPLGATLPMPGSITQESALVVVHVNVDVWPGSRISGLALISIVGATVTITLAIVVPPDPIAVIVYVVVSVGDTSIDPYDSTSPILGAMKHVPAR